MNTRIEDFYRNKKPLQIIKIDSPKIKYELKLYGRLTIITGLSASGKTTIPKILNEFENNKRDSLTNRIKVTSGAYILIYLNKDTIKESIRDFSTRIFIVDEDNDLLKTNLLFNLMEEYNKDWYFVILTREEFKHKDTSIADISILKTSGDNIVCNVPAYTIYDKYLTKKKLYRGFNPDIIFSEDSGAAFRVIKNIFKESINISAHGNGSLHIKVRELMKQNKDKTAIIFMDGANYSRFISTLLELEEEFNILVPNLESMEWLLLISIDNFKKVINEILYKNYNHYYLKYGTINKEKFYEKILTTIARLYRGKWNEFDELTVDILELDKSQKYIHNCAYEKKLNSAGSFYFSEPVKKSILDCISYEKENTLDVRWN